MLRKDNDNITKDIKKIFKDDLSFINKRTKTVTFKLVNSIFNGKDKTPRSYHIETAYVSRDSKTGDTSEYRYYKSENKKMIGGFLQETFSPELVSFGQRGDITINLGDSQTENLDFLIFFLNHPRMAKSTSGDGTKRALFYLEDKNKEAIDTVMFKKAKAKMDSFLYNEDTRLPDDKLITIAEALRIDGVEDMNIQRIQTSIEDKCKKNPSLFLGMAEVNDAVLMRSNIQKAVEKGYLSYSSLNKKWSLNDTDSSESSDLAPVRKLEDETDALVYWFNNVDVHDSYGKMLELLSGKPIDRTKKVETAENSELEIKLKLAEAENEKLRLQKETAEAELEKAKLSVLSEKKTTGQLKKKPVS